MAVLAGFMMLALAGFITVPAFAGGPVETSIFAVQGVQADVTSTDATAAKNQALMDVQVTAFFQLVEKLGSQSLAIQLQEKLTPEDIAPFLRSLSIEQESSAPGRYIGTFTVRFLPNKMEKFFEQYGIKVPTQQADPILVIPVLRTLEGIKLWEENPWRKAWQDLKAEQGIVPIIIPLGDQEDTEMLSADEAMNGDAVKLDQIRKRYDAPSLLVAMAEASDDGGLHVVMQGDTRLGRVEVNKVYKIEDGGAGSIETAVAAELREMLVKAYQSQAARMAVDQASRNRDGTQSLAVSVPFTSPREWNAIRARILTTPNVTAVDLSSLGTSGAVITLVFSQTVEELQSNMQRVGLNLTLSGDAWIIQSM